MILDEIFKLSELVQAIDKNIITISQPLDIEQLCAFWGAHDTLNMFEDIVVLTHGSPGCISSRRISELYRHSHMGQCDRNYKPYYTTDINHDDIVFGGERKLKASLTELLDMKQYKVVVVLSDCCTDIIGDDIEGVINSIEKKGCKVLSINSNSYKGRSFREGTDLAFETLLEIIDEKEKNEGTINLVTRRYCIDRIEQAEIDEMRRLTGILGIRIGEVIRRPISFRNIVEMSKASLNTTLCYTFSKNLFAGMEKRFGIPYCKETAPIGLNATLSWINEICLNLNIDNKKFENLDEVQGLLERRESIRNKTKGRYSIIWSIAERNLAWGRLAEEFGLIPILVNIDPFTIKDLMPVIKNYLETGFDPYVFCSSSKDQIYEVIKECNNPILFSVENQFETISTFGVGLNYQIQHGLRGTEILYENMENTLQGSKSSSKSLFR